MKGLVAKIVRDHPFVQRSLNEASLVVYRYCDIMALKARIGGEAWRKQSNGAIVGDRKTFRYKTKPDPLGSESGHIYTSRSQRQV